MHALLQPPRVPEDLTKYPTYVKMFKAYLNAINEIKGEFKAKVARSEKAKKVEGHTPPEKTDEQKIKAEISRKARKKAKNARAKERKAARKVEGEIQKTTTALKLAKVQVALDRTYAQAARQSVKTKIAQAEATKPANMMASAAEESLRRRNKLRKNPAMAPAGPFTPMTTVAADNVDSQLLQVATDPRRFMTGPSPSPATFSMAPTVTEASDSTTPGKLIKADPRTTEEKFLARGIAIVPLAGTMYNSMANSSFVSKACTCANPTRTPHKSNCEGMRGKGKGCPDT